MNRKVQRGCNASANDEICQDYIFNKWKCIVDVGANLADSISVPSRLRFGSGMQIEARRPVPTFVCCDQTRFRLQHCPAKQRALFWRTGLEVIVPNCSETANFTPRKELTVCNPT